jgi:hypothetical protein
MGLEEVAEGFGKGETAEQSDDFGIGLSGYANVHLERTGAKVDHESTLRFVADSHASSARLRRSPHL